MSNTTLTGITMRHRDGRAVVGWAASDGYTPESIIRGAADFLAFRDKRFGGKGDLEVAHAIIAGLAETPQTGIHLLSEEARLIIDIEHEEPADEQEASYLLMTREAIGIIDGLLGEIREQLIDAGVAAEKARASAEDKRSRAVGSSIEGRLRRSEEAAAHEKAQILMLAAALDFVRAAGLKGDEERTLTEAFAKTTKTGGK